MSYFFYQQVDYFKLIARRESGYQAEMFFYYPSLKSKITSKDTAIPLSHQVIASSNFFSSTQALAPDDNNAKNVVAVSCQEETQTLHGGKLLKCQLKID